MKEEYIGNLISIIVPVYNVKDYITVCVESVLAQTYRKWELILVDDGSKDGSGTICDSYMLQDERIKVIHKENAGVSAARNTGIENARGEFILFLDSDDYIDQHALELLIREMKEECSDCVFLSVKYIRDSDGLETICSIPSGKYDLDGALRESYQQLYNGHFFHAVWGKLFRKKVIENYHIRFEEEFSILEDGMFVVDYLKYCGSFVILNDVFYNYRQFEGFSLMKKFNLNAIEALEKKYDKEQYLRKKLDVSSLIFYYEDFFSGIWAFTTQIYSRSNFNSKKKKEMLYYYLSRPVTSSVINWLLCAKGIGVRKKIKCWILRYMPYILHVVLMNKY